MTISSPRPGSQSRLFSADHSADMALSQIAETLFDQITVIGRLQCGRRLDWPALEGYLTRSRAVALLGLLEHASELRFASTHGRSDAEAGEYEPRRVPFCYNRGDWPTGGQIAGYTDLPDAPLPHQVIISALGNWILDTQDTDKKRSSSMSRLLLVALWICSQHGLIAAVDMLIDLQLHGFLVDPEITTHVIITLLRGRSVTDTDEAMMRRFLRGRVPKTAARWIKANVSLGWLPSDGPTTDSTGIFAYLLRRGITGVEAVRAAANLDEWVLGCAEIYGLLAIVKGVADHSGLKLPVTVRAILGQLEEIRCDAAGVTELVLSIEGWAAAAQFISRRFQESFGDRWRDSLYRERLIVPAALRERLLDQRGEAPEEWRSLSWRVAAPFFAIREQVKMPLEHIRSRPFSVPEVLADQRIADLFEKHEIDDPADRYKIMDAELHSDIRPMVSLRYPRAELRQLIAGVHSDFAMQETIDLLVKQGASASEDAAQARQAELSRVIELYPYGYPARWETAISADDAGHHQDALNIIVQAISLAPYVDGLWSSLGVILHHVGHDKEARLAQTIGKYMAENPPGKVTDPG